VKFVYPDWVPQSARLRIAHAIDQAETAFYQLQTPVVIVVGGRDDVVSRDLAKEAAERRMLDAAALEGLVTIIESSIDTLSRAAQHAHVPAADLQRTVHELVEQAIVSVYAEQNSQGIAHSQTIPVETWA